MEKEITLTDIRAIFTKDTDYFGKMVFDSQIQDPLLELSIGKSMGKTEIAERNRTHNAEGGKQPKWKATVVLNYFDEQHLIVRALEDDNRSQDYLGEGKIDVKTLKATGAIECKIMDEG